MKIKKANNFLFFILRCIFIPFLFFRYGLKFRRATSKKIKRPCIIIANHSTFHDQFIVGTGFKFGINFVASDSIFRAGFKSRIMQRLASPIPIKKGAADASTVKNIMSVIRSGGAVALFPEGNRTFYGETCYVKPAIGRLAKKLGVPLVMVRIEGGFNTDPRWKNKVSKGKMSAYVSRVIEKDELNVLSDSEINEVIAKELYFNEYEFNKAAKIKFKGRRKAEYLETVLFACPECKTLDALMSEGNDLICTHCGATVRINAEGFFEKINNAQNVPDTVLSYSKRQIEIIKEIDYSVYSDKPLFADENVSLYSYEQAKKNELILTGKISFYSDRFTVGDRTLNFSDIDDMTVQGVNKFQIYMSDGAAYMIKAGVVRTNFMKYMICAYNIKKASNSGGDYYGY